MANSLASFLQLFQTSAANKELVKITLGGKRNKAADLNNVFIKPVALKAGDKLSFVYRHSTKDITKNVDLKEAIVITEKMLKEEFFNADLFTAVSDHHLLQNSNGNAKLVSKAASLAAKAGPQQHDKAKTRIVKTDHNIYLQQLGITTGDGLVKKTCRINTNRSTVMWRSLMAL
ncbi:MAG: hypothetical protein IPP72_00080 [Chitinophagaceae bacterium]|nr:hypothetical protein [Chitinophagaceae bacterium]